MADFFSKLFLVTVHFDNAIGNSICQYIIKLGGLQKLGGSALKPLISSAN